MRELRWAWSVAAPGGVLALVVHCAAGGGDGAIDGTVEDDAGAVAIDAYDGRDTSVDDASTSPDTALDAGSLDAPPAIDAGPPLDASAFFATTRVYMLTAKHSGQALSVEGSATADGANVHQRPDTAAPDQRWVLRATSAGDYQVVNAQSQRCLDVSGASTADGGNAAQWACLGSENQRWKLVYTGKAGYYEVVNVHSGKCLDVSGGSTAAAANVIQWTCSGSDNQLWKLTSDEPASNVPAHDPAVMKFGNAYYLFVTGGTLGIRRSFDLITWEDEGAVFPAIPAWVGTTIGGGAVVTDLWAPDISYFNGATSRGSSTTTTTPRTTARRSSGSRSSCGRATDGRCSATSESRHARLSESRRMAPPPTTRRPPASAAEARNPADRRGD